MLRNHREEKDKELRKLCETYNELHNNKYKAGSWVDVEPYQRGWVRNFVLRDDAKNRTDVRHMRQCLDMVNTSIYCHREDFKRKDYKTGKWEPISQKLGYITPDKFNKLDEKLQSYFYDGMWYEGEVRRRLVRGYRLKNDFYYVYEVNPNIVTQQWLPNSEHESKIAEIGHYIERNNLWPKISKALGHSSGYRDDSVYYRNKLGNVISHDDLDYEIGDKNA